MEDWLVWENEQLKSRMRKLKRWFATVGSLHFRNLNDKELKDLYVKHGLLFHTVKLEPQFLQVPNPLELELESVVSCHMGAGN
ncbi:hypothetical protein H671_1g3191 [Cricetulus griseus]|uniref:Uncharacterized protein n=1 Tax=Cricetulus griseus TaxID=10029 RepID=A0A061IHC1_CRIGR|nr:hypothetical protein H671_1g3191 [Cricetulus griseus]